MIEGSINGKSFELPANFKEFKKKHWRTFTRLLTDYRVNTWHDIKVGFLMKHLPLPKRKLLRMSRSKKFRDIEEYEEHISNIWLLAENLSYFETPADVKVNYFLRIRRGIFKRPLYGPADNLSNVELWEYAMAEKAADDFLHNENTDALNELFAVLYRFKKPFWFIRKYITPEDPRVKFHDNLIDRYTRKSKRVPKRAKIFLYIFFNSVRAEFPDRFKSLYKKKTDTESGSEGSGWSDLIVAFTGTTPGDEEKTGRTNIWWILKRMDHLAEEADKIKAKTEKSKNNV